MVKLAVVTAETTIMEKGGQRYPCIVVYARDKNGNRKKWTQAFWPYCYLNEMDYINLNEEGFKFHNVIKTEGIKGRSLTKRALTKLTFADSKHITDFIHVLRKHQEEGYKDPVYTYEADLAKAGLLALRYLIDKGIRSGFNINERTNEIRPIEFVHPLRTWFLDFEAYSVKQCSYGPKPKEPITMASYYDTYDHVMKTLYVNNPLWKSTPIFKPTTDKHIIIPWKKESQMLDYMVEDVRDRDPDMFTAWNLDRYDMIKWKQRMDANRKRCIYSFKDLSPMHSLLWNRRPYRIKGRITFDLLKAFKRFTDAELRSYSLMYVTESEGFEMEKVPFRGTAARTWDLYPEVVFRRNVNDVLIIKELDSKYGLIEMFDDLKREFGALFHEILMNYRVLDTALMRFVNKKIILKTTSRGKSKEGTFLGAAVIEPKPAPYKWIVQFDFSREYPNIMITFNISPETYRKPDYKGDCYTIKYRNIVYKFVKRPIGLLPQLIKSFFKKRDSYEKKYALAIKSGNEAEIKKWWRRVFNIKKMTNAIYGVMDFASFRLFKKECSAAVAVVGRLSIEELEKIADRLGYKTIYGDTDSIFVDLKSDNLESCIEEAKMLKKELNKGLAKFFIEELKATRAPSDLGLKKIYIRYLLLGKKNYAGKSLWDEKKGCKVEYDFKGFEVIRSDSSRLEKETLEKLVKMYLDGEPIKELMGYKDEVLNLFNKHEHSPIEIAYPLQIKRPFNYYDINRMPAHVRSALYSNRFLNTDFEHGDKPSRLPIKVKKKLSIKSGQTTLFKTKENYPTVWDYKEKEFRLRNISIAEDMVIPDWFMDNIDWERIYVRLSRKHNRIMELLGNGNGQKMD